MTDEPNGPGIGHRAPVDAAPTAPPAGAEERRLERARVRDMIDLAEGRIPVPLLDDPGIARVLRDARRIAIVGASARPYRPSHGVMASLLRAGYDVVPVTPAEREVLGRRAYPDLPSAVDAEGPVDIVDVFRRPETCAAHAAEAVRVGARCLWLQLGVVELGRGADRGGGRARGRDGPLHGDRGQPPRPGVGPGRDRQRIANPATSRISPRMRIAPPTCTWRRRISIATDAPVLPSARRPPRHAS